MTDEMKNAPDPTSKPKSKIGKKLLALLFFIIVGFLWLWYQHLPPSTEKYDKLDNASYNTFTVETTAELNNSVDQSLDEFLDEVTSMKSLFYTVTDLVHITDNEKEKHLAELWEKHINKKVDKIITDRVKMLVEDMFIHNNECMQALQTSGVNVKAFERKIRDDLISSMSRQGVKISGSGVNDAAINFAIANTTGAAAGWTVTLLKGGWYTYLIGVLVDMAVSEFIDNKLNTELKGNMKKKIQYALNDALNGNNGLYANIKKAIDTFHAERAEEIAKAEKTM